MLLEYQDLDIIGKNSSVSKSSELGSRSEKRSCYERHTHNLNLDVDLNYLLSFFGGLRHFFSMISRVRKIRNR